ncbi:MAG: hypothetical protein C5B52_12570 [Bacteroidetes bacterium]|nr:MAG: hypothetical protein C5B52_12570 [Bacteroidota bacterium]
MHFNQVEKFQNCISFLGSHQEFEWWFLKTETTALLKYLVPSTKYLDKICVVDFSPPRAIGRLEMTRKNEA